MSQEREIAPPGDPGARMTDTRGALLDAGVRLYSSRAGELLKGISAGSVAREAGFHRQTFYRYWETQAEYVQDLLRHALTTEQPPVADGVTLLPTRVPPDDLAAFARDLAQHDFRRVLEDSRARMRIGLLFTGALGTAELSEDVGAFYEMTMASVAEGYESLLDSLGLETVDDTTARDLARTVQALLFGLVVQSITKEDDPHGSVLLERATRALLEAFTRPVANGGESAAG